MKIAFGCDHAGFNHRDKIINYLKSLSYKVKDAGCFSRESCDYPLIAEVVSSTVSENQCEKGILICGTGIGMSIVANKFPGVRAAVCWSEDIVRLAAGHNDANILCLPARFATAEQMIKWIEVWINTPRSIESRHLHRIEIIAELESKLHFDGGKK